MITKELINKIIKLKEKIRDISAYIYYPEAFNTELINYFQEVKITYKISSRWKYFFPRDWKERHSYEYILTEDLCDEFMEFLKGKRVEYQNELKELGYESENINNN